jgi:hypothetical protein
MLILKENLMDINFLPRWGDFSTPCIWKTTQTLIRGGECLAIGPNIHNDSQANLWTSLGESENVVNEQQHILSFLVSEIFSNSEACQSHSSPSARGLIHLAIHQRYL